MGTLEPNILLMNNDKQGGYVDSIIPNNNKIQLITNSKLSTNTGIKLKYDNDNIYQITQVKDNISNNDIPIMMYGGRRVIEGNKTNSDLLSTEVTNFKSTDIDKIIYGKNDKLEKKPRYINDQDRITDDSINKMFNSEYEPNYSDKDFVNEMEGGASLIQKQNNSASSDDESSDDTNPEEVSINEEDIDASSSNNSNNSNSNSN